MGKTNDMTSVNGVRIVCAECGSDNIMEKMWFNPNTGENHGWDESDECYCHNCGKMTTWKEEPLNKKTMTREEMYEKKVLTNGEYNSFVGNVGACGDRYLDIVEDYRGVIRWLMEKLYEKNGCTEFVVSHFTIINHIDEGITIINHEVDDSDETPLDDIFDIQMLNLICETSI